MQSYEHPSQKAQLGAAALRAVKGNLSRLETRANTNVSVDEAHAVHDYSLNSPGLVPHGTIASTLEVN
ncbi:hypothetical protein Tco_0300497 [Tanacetum coccineum]